MTKSKPTRKQLIRMEIAAARAEFHALLASLSEQEFRQQSINPGWTNGEVLAHMVFGFWITSASLPLTRLWGRPPRGSSRGLARLLDALTGPFNWFNALGTQMQAKRFTYVQAGEIFDRTYHTLLGHLDAIREEEWARGMYYPTRWDPNFDEFMTIEKLFHYPALHFKLHLGQIRHSVPA